MTVWRYSSYFVWISDWPKARDPTLLTTDEYVLVRTSNSLRVRWSTTELQSQLLQYNSMCHNQFPCYQLPVPNIFCTKTGIHRTDIYMTQAFVTQETCWTTVSKSHVPIAAWQSFCSEIVWNEYGIQTDDWIDEGRGSVPCWFSILTLQHLFVTSCLQ